MQFLPSSLVVIWLWDSTTYKKNQKSCLIFRYAYDMPYWFVINWCISSSETVYDIMTLICLFICHISRLSTFFFAAKIRGSTQCTHVHTLPYDWHGLNQEIESLTTFGIEEKVLISSVVSSAASMSWPSIRSCHQSTTITKYHHQWVPCLLEEKFSDQQHA